MIKGMFGQKRQPFPGPWDDKPVTTPPINPGYPQEGAGSIPMSSMAQEPQKKPGFFQRPGVSEGIGTFADTLIKLRSGVDPGLMRGIENRQERAYQAQAAQQAKMEQRQYDNKNWLFQQKWALDNPNNDTANDFNFFKSLPPEDRSLFQQMKPQWRVDPATGQFVQVQTSQPVADSEFGGWGDETPPATVGIPRPNLGANGQPSELTPQQYQAIVQTLGKQKTDDWVKQFNIRVPQ